jgi:ribosomal protein S18 acetylase RimI-like enzyme
MDQESGWPDLLDCRHQVPAPRDVDRKDLTALKTVIDATGLFPAELLDDMLTGFLAGERPEERCRTIDYNGRSIAIAYLAPEPMTDGTSNLLLLAVHPEHQGIGIGQLLMRDAEASLAERGERILLVETSSLPEFERTRDFYRRLGYIQEARIRDYYAAGEDKIVFWKALQAQQQIHPGRDSPPTA